MPLLRTSKLITLCDFKQVKNYHAQPNGCKEPNGDGQFVFGMAAYNL